jgi:prepilin peptidase CpaA
VIAFVEAGALSIAAVLIAVAAWQDFTVWKIRNWTVLALIADYCVLAMVLAAGDLSIAGLDPRSDVLGDLAAGSLLFAIGLVLWLLRMLGAGDAKFFFPIGLFVGLFQLFAFAIGLAVGAVLVSMALQFPVPLPYQSWSVLARLEEIRQTRKVPYGTIMAPSALVAMYLRYWG